MIGTVTSMDQLALVIVMGKNGGHLHLRARGAEILLQITRRDPLHYAVSIRCHQHRLEKEQIAVDLSSLFAVVSRFIRNNTKK